MCFAMFATLLPVLAFISICEALTLTMANSAATKKPFKKTKKMVKKTLKLLTSGWGSILNFIYF